jgi:predicted alpha-1,2-mannosidase
MKSWFLTGTSLLFFISTHFTSAQTNYSSYVNPFIGTGGHGHTFPGAVLPFGMVQLSPDTRVDGSWDGCGGYHYSDSLIYGFSHTHLSGTGCSDWGDILVMPVSGKPGSMDQKEYSSPFSHRSEVARPGFYEATLSRHHIKAELTTTLRTGIHRYTFQENQPALIVDLLHRDKTLYSSLAVKDSVTIVGCRFSSAWAKDQRVYFAMRFSHAFKKMEYASRRQLKPVLISTEKAEGAWFQFAEGNKELLVKVAISSVSEEGALKNLEAEAPHWDFDKYRGAAEQTWNRQLGKIEITDNDKDKLTTFYTALYHCCIHPSLYMDVDKQYRGRDNNIHSAEGFTNYSVFSLWDTYRALNPLFTILEPGRTSDFINSFLSQYKQSGRLPMWELSGNETDCMISFHSVSVISDAMAKGITGFDTQLAYEAMKAASNYSAWSIPVFNRKGFLQVDDESESVSKTLEYAYDNWCIAQAARLLNKPEDVNPYMKRSSGYRNLFDASTGCMRPRKNGGWLEPFSPSEINNHFTEGNSWQYSFYVPHDLNGLIKLHGGAQGFEKKLDELFTTTEKNQGRDQADVTGLIGQYAHGNEPSHHMAYLYNFVGKPEKTGVLVHRICSGFYTNAPDGLIGNEDCGQMSAWYVFSAMGMYPVCPGQPQYVLGAPLFKKIKINLDHGKVFTINSVNPGKPVKGILMNGKPGLVSAIQHNFVNNGGQLEFLSDSALARPYGRGLGVPSSVRNDIAIIPAPLIFAARVFKEKQEVKIQPLSSGSQLCVYTLDGSEPTRASTVYDKPFFITATTTVKAKAFSGNDSSSVSEGVYHKLKYDYDIHIVSQVNAQYAAEGPRSLTDGVAGSTDWRKGDWLGFQGQNVEYVVDLGKTRELSHFGLNCLQDTRSWIVLPIRVNFYGSADNKTFTLIGSVDHQVKAEDYKIQLHHFELQAARPVKARYVKIVAESFGKLPDWHEGQGGESFIFTDELEVK